MAGAIDPSIGNMQCGTDDSLSCRLIRAIKNWRIPSTSTDEIIELIDLGADINKGDDNNVTPIHWAVNNNNIQCVKLMLVNGANINICNKYNVTPLYCAVLNNNIKCVQLLLQHGADTNICNKYNITPLYCAVLNNNRDCVQLLLQQGADTNLCNSDNRTPLYCAARNNNIKCVQLLLQHRADVDVLDKNYNSALNLAAHSCHLEIIKILLDYNANVNTRNLHGQTPLMEAALNVSRYNTEENMACLELLIQASGQFDFRNENGELIPDIALDNELSKLLLPYCVHPRSLKELCRYQLRSSLRHQFLPDAIPLLNLPKTVQRFVLLQ